MNGFGGAGAFSDGKLNTLVNDKESFSLERLNYKIKMEVMKLHTSLYEKFGF